MRARRPATTFLRRRDAARHPATMSQSTSAAMAAPKLQGTSPGASPSCASAPSANPARWLSAQIRTLQACNCRSRQREAIRLKTTDFMHDAGKKSCFRILMGYATGNYMG